MFGVSLRVFNSKELTCTGLQLIHIRVGGVWNRFRDRCVICRTVLKTTNDKRFVQDWSPRSWHVLLYYKCVCYLDNNCLYLNRRKPAVRSESLWCRPKTANLCNMHITYAQYASLCVSIDINLESGQVGSPPPGGTMCIKWQQQCTLLALRSR